MPLDPGVYSHHPHLADLIADPEGAAMRTMQPSDFDAGVIESGGPADWRYTDEERIALWQEEMAGRFDRDLWVFGYGSLMWNPALMFEEVRLADLPGHVRRMCMIDTLGGRGSMKAPGLIAGLDTGAGTCTGLAFRIPAAAVATETEILWRRERLCPGYRTAFVGVETAQGPVEALTFVADHAAEGVDVAIPRAEQVRMIRGGEGVLGTSLAYLQGMVTHLRDFGIHDAELEALLAEAEAEA